MNFGILILMILIAAFSVAMFWAGGPIKQPDLLIGIVFLAAIDLALYLVERSERKRLTRLAAAFDEGGAKVRGGMLSHRRVEGHFRGREVTLRSQRGGRGTPGSITLRLACSSSLHFKFWKASHIRLVQPGNSFQVGDAEIDREFSFVSQDSDRVTTWLLHPENKENVLAMLRRGLVGTSLELKRGSLSWVIYGSQRLLEPQEQKPAAESGSTELHFGGVIVQNVSLNANLERITIRKALENLSQVATALEKSA